jgi:hypothetical protein
MQPSGSAGYQENANQDQPGWPDQPGQEFSPPSTKSFLFGAPPGQSPKSFGPCKGDFPWD